MLTDDANQQTNLIQNSINHKKCNKYFSLVQMDKKKNEEKNQKQLCQDFHQNKPSWNHWQQDNDEAHSAIRHLMQTNK